RRWLGIVSISRLRMDWRRPFHQWQSEPKQHARAERVSHRVPDAPALVRGCREKAVDDPGKEPVWPVGMNSLIGGVEFLHSAPETAAIFRYGHLVSRNPFVRDVSDVLHIVKESDCVVIGSEQYDLAVERQEAIERRIQPYSVQ